MTNDKEPVQIDELLTSWELADLIPDFQKHKIDVDVLPKMTKELVEKIIEPAGWQIKFIQHWERHFKKKLPKEVTYRNNSKSHDYHHNETSSSIDDSDSDTENSPNNSTEYDNYIGGGMLRQLQQLPKIEQIFKETAEGRQVLNSYKKTKCLGRLARRSVVDILTSFLLNHVEEKANHKDFQYFAEEIIRIFPNEDINYYYIAPVKKSKSSTKKSISVRGRLAIKYWSRLKKFRLLDKSAEIETEQLDATIDESVQMSVDWLKNNRAPWDLVIRHWETTFDVREKEFLNGKDKNLVDIFQKWPILNHPEAYKLILEDFSQFKFTDEGIDYKAADKWFEFFEKVKEVCPLDSKKKKDARVRHLFNFLDAANTEDDKALIQLCLLPYLVAPKGRLRKSKKDDWKYSMLESEESIVRHATTIDDITRICEDYKAIMKEKGLKVQPHILVVGPELNKVENVYVIIDDVKYNVDSVLKAIDVCFKSFYVFQLEFPSASQHIWFLIQRGLYKFKTSSDKMITYVLEVVTDIRNLGAV